MQKYKYGFFLLLILSIYLVINKQNITTSEKQPVIVKDAKCEEKLSDLRERVGRFVTNELPGYLVLKDHKKKYLKANELLGKSMLLFLGSLGLQLSEKEREWIEFQKWKLDNDTIGKTVFFGPEVILNPYKEKECPILEPQKQAEVKTPNIKGNKPKEFLNLLKKRRQNDIKWRVDNDIFKNYWSDFKTYAGELNPLKQSFVEPYIGEYKGQLLFDNKIVIDVKAELEIIPIKKGEDTLIDVSITSEKETPFMALNQELSAWHPISHNNTGSGPCRAIILKNKNYTFTFIKLRRGESQTPNLIVGKIYSHLDGLKGGTEFARFFLVDKNSELLDWGRY